VREDRERWRSQAEVTQRLLTGPRQDHRPWWRRIAGAEHVKLITLLGSIVLMLAIIADKLK
jgi:hypothetical protein